MKKSVLTFLCFFTSLLLLSACSEEPASPEVVVTLPAPAPVIEYSVEPDPVPIVETSPLPDVIVLHGIESAQQWLAEEDWWGEENREQQLTVPRALITSISSNWQENSKNMPVANKKEYFYRFILPLVMHANVIIRDRRARLEVLKTTLSGGEILGEEDFTWLLESAVTLRVVSANSLDDLKEDSAAQVAAIEQLLYQLDEIPAGLALGQAAYESGYGTSRFAVQGNALFGQWTFDGSGIAPEQQRKELGDYGIASFEWPFDSVRSYVINLSRHAAYEDFRRMRAEMRANGEPLDSIKLAEGLVKYSERGQEYVETLQGIMRVNNLTIADQAVFRDEDLRFLIGADDAEDASTIEAELAAMRESGELADIVERMDLD